MTKEYNRQSFVARPAGRARKIERLGITTTGRGDQRVKWPSFDPRNLGRGILHFGCGAFHRAHQNIFTQRAIELERDAKSDWGVVGVSFRSNRTRQLLAPQDFLYTVLERDQDSTSAEVVGVLRGMLSAGNEKAEVIAAIKDPQTRIITLTVTASGYAVAPVHSEAQPNVDPDAIGLLVNGLAAVRTQGTAPPVLISCDNIPANGRHLRQALIQRAELASPSLGRWIDQNVQCPSSVVDRIVPVPAAQDSITASGLLGLQDLAAVATEPFRQWVIEDFEGARPAWERAGAKFVADTLPWEASKLKLLNGTHMAIAYLGILSGLKTVSDFVLDPLFAEYAWRFMIDEQIPTIPKSDHDLVSYSGQLLERWRNTKMLHQLQRIARNGSEKLQPRLLCSLARNMATGRPAPCTMLAVAAWVCYAARILPFDGVIEDASSSSLEKLAEHSRGDTKLLLRTLLSRADIFGHKLPHMAAFRDELSSAINCLKQNGVRKTVSRIVSLPVGS